MLTFHAFAYLLDLIAFIIFFRPFIFLKATGICQGFLQVVKTVNIDREEMDYIPTHSTTDFNVRFKGINRIFIINGKYL